MRRRFRGEQSPDGAVPDAVADVWALCKRIERIDLRPHAGISVDHDHRRDVLHDLHVPLAADFRVVPGDESFADKICSARSDYSISSYRTCPGAVAELNRRSARSAVTPV